MPDGFSAGAVAKLIQIYGSLDPQQFLEVGRRADGMAAGAALRDCSASACRSW
jgi:hypothetical protein